MHPKETDEDLAKRLHSKKKGNNESFFSQKIIQIKVYEQETGLDVLAENIGIKKENLEWK